jgi:hypothetical protein
MIVKPHATKIYFPVEPGQRLVWVDSCRSRQTVIFPYRQLGMLNAIDEFGQKRSSTIAIICGSNKKAIPAIKGLPGRARKRPGKLHADRAYAS